MSVSIRVSFLITPIHCITQTEEPKVINDSVDAEEIFVDTNPLEDIQENNFRRVDEAAQFAAAQNLVAFNYLTVNYLTSSPP